MDNNLITETENTSEQIACIKCGSPQILAGYPNKLCADCRQQLIKFPIPLWVKLFGAGIALVMIISFIWLPGNLSAAIALSRAEKAEKSHDYITAQNELKKAQNNAPHAIEILSHLTIAAFHNGDFKTVLEASDKLQGKEIEDTALYNELNNVITQTNEYFPSDTFKTSFKKYKNLVIPDSAYRTYIKKNPMDIYTIVALASSYSDNNDKYQNADTLLSKAIAIDRSYIPALYLKTMIKRELNQPDSSIYYCDQVLLINHQSTYALSSKARTFLKVGKNKEGLLLAKQCYQLDADMPYNLATLALAYHFNKDFKQRDAILDSVKKDSTNAPYITYVKDIISNKIKFQN
ncbi:hypothetical protein JN11_01300 [Mucilaginibacter frigoritolerans]|uniref:Tetratricopeptide repeat protein n=1 Tax=Mucilaginibacter frigoritolerans TaxID=652788 RepID=A0A562U992_9SPHI|nr:hypothetical protein [Mucilaginibacter frigoritolerans]TWJ02328.1 hypothetical protein JN11_01300 [Mucilaginibacter frigoritolerans]